MWALMLHAGATEIAPEKQEAYREGCAVALQVGRDILEKGGSAVDAVLATIISLENDSTFNAGYGCALNSCGEVEMNAALMDGKTMDIGAVAVLKRVKNPILVANHLLREETIFLAGDGAHDFAEAKGVEFCDPAALIAPGKYSKRSDTHDTVGCIALDEAGNFAAASSTGGIEGRPPGRIGDSPLPGCGYYAENGIGANTLSGDGEYIARMMLPARIHHKMAQLGPQEAVELSLAQMKRIGGEAGAIAISQKGIMGWAHNSPHFAVGVASSARPDQIYLQKSEEE